MRLCDSLLAVLLLVQFLHFASLFILPTKGSLTRDSHYNLYYVGETISLHCHKDVDVDFTGTVGFLYGNVMVPMEYVKRINNTYARMDKPVTSEDFARTTYQCVDGQHSRILINLMGNIFTDYRPRNATDLQVFWLNKTDVHLSWDFNGTHYKNADRHSVMQFTANWRTGFDNVSVWNPCSQESNHSCNITGLTQDDTELFLRVNVTNRIRGDFAVTYFPPLMLNAFAKPLAMESVTVSSLNSTAAVVRVSTDQPMLNYTITYTSDGRTGELVTGMTTDKEWTITNLHPSAVYEFEVRARFEQGYPSERPQSVPSLKMPEDAPSAAPIIPPGSYFLDDSTCSKNASSARLYVYFQEIPKEEQNGVIESYQGGLTKGKSVMLFPTSPKTFPFHGVPCERDLDVNVFGRTQVGTSPAASVSVSPRHPDIEGMTKDLKLRIRVTDEGVQAEWTPPSSPQDLSLYLYYCTKRGDGSCQDYIQYVKTDATVGHQRLEVAEPSMKFGVAIVTAQGLTNGISFTDCLYNPSMNPGSPPSNLLAHRHGNHIDVRWTRQTCDRNTHVVVNSYVLQVCLTHDHTSCQQYTVDSRRSNFTVEDVDPSVACDIRIQASTTSSRPLTRFSDPVRVPVSAGYQEGLPSWAIAVIVLSVIMVFVLAVFCVCLFSDKFKKTREKFKSSIFGDYTQPLAVKKMEFDISTASSSHKMNEGVLNESIDHSTYEEDRTDQTYSLELQDSEDSRSPEFPPDCSAVSIQDETNNSPTVPEVSAVVLTDAGISDSENLSPGNVEKNVSDTFSEVKDLHTACDNSGKVAHVNDNDFDIHANYDNAFTTLTESTSSADSCKEDYSEALLMKDGSCNVALALAGPFQSERCEADTEENKGSFLSQPPPVKCGDMKCSIGGVDLPPGLANADDKENINPNITGVCLPTGLFSGDKRERCHHTNTGMPGMLSDGNQEGQCNGDNIGLTLPSVPSIADQGNRSDHDSRNKAAISLPSVITIGNQTQTCNDDNTGVSLPSVLHDTGHEDSFSENRARVDLPASRVANVGPLKTAGYEAGTVRSPDCSHTGDVSSTLKTAGCEAGTVRSPDCSHTGDVCNTSDSRHSSRACFSHSENAMVGNEPSLDINHDVSGHGLGLTDAHMSTGIESSLLPCRDGDSESKENDHGNGTGKVKINNYETVCQHGMPPPVHLPPNFKTESTPNNQVLARYNGICQEAEGMVLAVNVDYSRSDLCHAGLATYTTDDRENGLMPQENMDPVCKQTLPADQSMTETDVGYTERAEVADNSHSCCFKVNPVTCQANFTQHAQNLNYHFMPENSTPLPSDASHSDTSQAHMPGESNHQKCEQKVEEETNAVQQHPSNVSTLTAATTNVENSPGTDSFHEMDVLDGSLIFGLTQKNAVNNFSKNAGGEQRRCVTRLDSGYYSPYSLAPFTPQWQNHEQDPSDTCSMSTFDDNDDDARDDTGSSFDDNDRSEPHSRFNADRDTSKVQQGNQGPERQIKTTTVLSFPSCLVVKESPT